LTTDALAFVRAIWGANCKRIAIENPIGILSKNIRKPDQIIQPWMFGDDASKQTCLWLKGLPKLLPTSVVPPKGWHNVDSSSIELGQDSKYWIKPINGILFAHEKTATAPPKMIWGYQTPSGQNKLGPSPDRAKLRSKTYQGIADAMAATWSRCL
jgi:hypothetical protein